MHSCCSRFFAAGLALVGAVFASAAASAAPIIISFEGTVAAGTIGWGTATTGDPVSGFFTFDDGLVDQLNASDGAARWGVGASTAGLTASLTAGGNTETGDSLNDSNGAFVQMFDDSVSNDTLNVSVEGLSIALLELAPATTAMDLLDDGFTIDPIQTAIDVFDVLDPADFTNSAASSWIVTAGSDQIKFTLTDFTVVPEPGTALLLGLGLAGLAVRRKQS